MRPKRSFLSVVFLLLVGGLGEARFLAYGLDRRGVRDPLPLRRGIGDLLEEVDEPKPQEVPQSQELPISHKELDSVLAHQTASLTRLISATGTRTAVSTAHVSPTHPPTTTSSINSASSTQTLFSSTSFAPSPTSTNSVATASQSKSSFGSSSSWKIVGIAVIAVSVIGGGILAALFFDHWWGFLRDVFGVRKNRKGPGGEEELVPDWEKGSWEYKFDSHGSRYPSFGSLPPDCRPPVGEVVSASSPPVGPGIGAHGRGVGGMSDYQGEVPSRAVVRDDARFYGDIYDGAYPPGQASYSPPAAFQAVNPAHEHRMDQAYTNSGVHRSNTSTSFAPGETAYGGVVVSPVPR